MILTLQEPTLVHLRSNLRGKDLVRRTQGGEKLVVGFVGGGGVHLLLAGGGALHALEMQADVVVGGVRVRAWLRMIVPPESATGVKYGACRIAFATGSFGVLEDGRMLKYSP